MGIPRLPAAKPNWVIAPIPTNEVQLSPASPNCRYIKAAVQAGKDLELDGVTAIEKGRIPAHVSSWLCFPVPVVAKLGSVCPQLQTSQPVTTAFSF